MVRNDTAKKKKAYKKNRNFFTVHITGIIPTYAFRVIPLT